jgi:predicted transport protein
VRIRFRDDQQPVTSWKDAFIKLLKQFDASSPGLLLRIATEQTLTAVIAMNEDRFHRSKAQIGNVFINTHASAAQLQDWCGKVAEIGRIGSNDFEFVMSDDATLGTLGKRKSVKPVRIRFRDIEHPALNWKDAFTKLLTLFDANSPGLLQRIANEQILPAVIAMDSARFRGSEVRIGEVFVNTSASAAQLQKWCRKVAEIGRIGSTDFAFVMPDDASESIE